MKKIITQIDLLVLSATIGYSQTAIEIQDQNINNLVHSTGYKTSELGAMPQYVKVGKGRQTMILIPAWGFDASVFADFMEANKNNYTMYAITIPGYGNTMAPPMPDTSISYGEQTWNKGVLKGIIKLIEKEKIEKPVIAGHATQGTQLALRMAIDYPDKVSWVIVLGGHAKFISVMQGKPTDHPLQPMVAFTDNYIAPTWFKGITKKDFDDGNYLPGVYSLDSIKGADLWKQSATPPLPVLVHYICEFFASDIKTEIDKIKCPVLILRAMFNNEVLDAPVNNYVKPQFIDSWNDVPSKNPLVKVVDIKDAATFVWKDKPVQTYSLIKDFLNQSEFSKMTETIMNDDIIKEVNGSFDKMTEYSEKAQLDQFLSYYDSFLTFLHFGADGKMRNYDEFKKSCAEYYDALRGQKITTIKKKIHVIDKNLVVLGWTGNIVAKLKNGDIMKMNNYSITSVFKKIDNKWKVIHSHESSLQPEIIKKR